MNLKELGLTWKIVLVALIAAALIIICIWWLRVRYGMSIYPWVDLFLSALFGLSLVLSALARRHKQQKGEEEKKE